MTTFDALWSVVLLADLAHSAHQGLTSNLSSTVSDLLPRSAVASVVGFGGTAGQIGAAIMVAGSGLAIATTGSFSVTILVAGTTRLAAFLVFRVLVPELRPIDFKPVEDIADESGKRQIDSVHTCAKSVQVNLELLYLSFIISDFSRLKLC